MAETFRLYIERPVLTNIETTFEGIDVYDVEPYSIPDVFAERPIIVYGKYHTPAEGNISITGDYSTGVVTSSLDFSDYTANNDENVALKYLWARKRIKLMSDYGIASNENDNLVTEYTSFVAVDSSAVATNTEGSGNDDGTLVDSFFLDADSETGHIKILGTIIDAGKSLSIELEGLTTFNNLSLRISNISGQTILSQDLNPGEIKNIITIPLSELPVGFYFISLIHDNQVLDTEKFMVAK